jgi:hypothetical protein
VRKSHSLPFPVSDKYEPFHISYSSSAEFDFENENENQDEDEDEDDKKEFLTKPKP